MARKAVFGIVKTHSEAESLVRSLKQVGFSSSDISVLFPDREGTRDFAHEKNTKAPEGAVAGVGAGGVAGGTLGRPRPAALRALRRATPGTKERLTRLDARRLLVDEGWAISTKAACREAVHE